MPSFKDSFIFIFCKGLQGRKIHMPPWWLILACRSLRTFVQEKMEKIPVWCKSLHFQWVIWQGGGGTSLLFSSGDEWPLTALTLPCILKSSWSCQCWKNGVREQLSGSVCNYGKRRGWRELLNILFFLKKKKNTHTHTHTHTYIYIVFFFTFLWLHLFLPAHVLTSSCQ